MKMARRHSTPATDRAIRGDGNIPLSKTVKIEDLRGFFHLPIVEVAKQLGTCTTALKKICRKNKIKKWPYRQIRSITKSIQSLEMASLNDSLQEELRTQYRDQISTLQKAIDDLIHDPNANVSLLDMKLDGDDDDDDDGDDLGPEERIAKYIPKPVSSNVQQIMLAAAATAGIECTAGRAPANNKRKAEGALPGNEEGQKADENRDIPESALAQTNVPPQIQAPIMITIGETTVSQIPNIGEGKGRAHFVGPVVLAPLQRKKLKISKKLVPLIEPDICNHFRMDFLPQSILQYKYLHTATDGTTRMSSSVMDYQHIQQQHIH
jgi:hypothetical protein